MVPRIDAAIRVSGDRRLAYAEYGDGAGVPVFVFHGLPGTRLSWGMLPDGSFPPAVRIIAPDRPGYGGSDPNPGRTLLDWANDVETLADSLAIPGFAIVGISGGGPGALACAWKMPQRLTTVGIVSSPAPTDAPGVFDGISGTNRFFMKLTWYVPWLSSANTRFLAAVIRRHPRRYLDTMKYKIHDVDKAILARPEIHEMLVKDFAEAVRGGAAGMVDDMAANHGRPWGFALDQIRTEVLLWSCELDRSVPPAMGKYLSDVIPSCQANIVPGQGHLWILVHLREVLDEVTRASPRG
ncbi:alpha/beta fold hydrolase [Mycobacterium spongiae]|uniref:Alpha/beta fold hydrolase n=1 Tax=Mycobacterium spongiae TaxID=886343 RepID=A0A975JWY9_9MYCO|nr:alpha/beta hydrolase [Mycobacterium spongiae]QUR67230.1 alpha/beta fold hydrolase [Mycobacterium spongiae]